MKNVLIKNATIIDSQSEFNNSKQDILIENGIIIAIAQNLKPTKNSATQIIDSPNLYVSIGWMDMRVNFNDPGLEHKEDLASGAAAALAGGFTAVACMGTTQPALHNKAQIAYIINKASTLPVDIFPIGTVSNKAEGNDLAELYDMFLSGAVAFSDNKNAIDNAHLLQRAMLYASGFSQLIIQLPCDKKMAHDGKMNEGVISTTLGLKGIPSIAEELMITRDLMLAAYNNCAIHIGGISSKGSVDLIREAKQKGIKVTCDVHAANLFLEDNLLTGFDTNYKLMPPLRTAEDREALIAGLMDDTIDVICSDHTPHDIESKMVEFDVAAFGMIGLESFWGVVNTSLNNQISIEKIIKKITYNPRHILNIALPAIKVNEKANLTVFNVNEKWNFALNDIYSKSKNTPFVGTTFTGKVVSTIINK